MSRGFSRALHLYDVQRKEQAVGGKCTVQKKGEVAEGMDSLCTPEG
jgi:hypothetical protein